MKSNIANKNIENSLKDIHSQSIILSLPLSQENTEYVPLPSNVLLSNYCCEYDKAYTKKDLRPISYRNYYSNRVIHALKNEFDKIITPKQSLQSFFNTTDNIFEQSETDLHKTFDNILCMLQNELDENITMTDNLIF
jgi:hypothetical protein